MGLIYKDGTLAETVVDEGVFRFAVYKKGKLLILASLPPKEGIQEILPPYGLRALCDAGLVRFPSSVEEYGSPPQLIKDIRAFLHRYAEIPPFWEELIAHYVLMSWVYDRFTALPYLRFLGEPQTGKSRILLLCAALMFRPMIVSGNITGPALFRLIDLVQGTMIVDEADFKDSNEWSDIVKILNTGYTVGFPIVRCSDARSAYTPVASPHLWPQNNQYSRTICRLCSRNALYHFRDQRGDRPRSYPAPTSTFIRGRRAQASE